MGAENSAPKLIDIIQQKIYGKYGIAGLVALFLCGVTFYVWTHWDEVKKWPGLVQILERLSQRAIPKADPERFSILVADLERDPNREHKQLIIELLKPKLSDSLDKIPVECRPWRAGINPAPTH